MVQSTEGPYQKYRDGEVWSLFEHSEHVVSEDSAEELQRGRAALAAPHAGVFTNALIEDIPGLRT